MDDVRTRLEWERAAGTIVDASMTDVVWFEPAQTFGSRHEGTCDNRVTNS